MRNLLLLALMLTGNPLFSQDTYTYVNPNAGLDQDSYIELYDGRFGDMNGDGFIDINEVDHYIPYLGGANFGEKLPLGLPELAPPYMDIEDVNNDGYDDLANNTSWYENLGNSQFTESKLRPDYIQYDVPKITGTSSISISIGDYDGDGDYDRILYSQLDYSFYLYENIDNTHYLDRVLLGGSEIFGGFFFPSSINEIRTEDFNNDGLIDVVVITSKKLIYFHNEGNMVFSSAGNLHDDDFTIRRWDIEDINLDGYLDIVLGTLKIQGGSAYGGIIFCKGTDKGIESTKSIFSEGPVDDVKFGIKEDGTHAIYSVFQSSVWNHAPNSNYTSFTRSEIISNANGRYLIIRDLDSDEDIDIIVHSPSANRIGYYLKNEDITFEPICPDANVVINKQSQLDDYKLNFGNCRDLEYSLTISEDDGWMMSITSLEALSNLETIAGDFSLNDIINLDMEPFASLRHIKGGLNINHFKVKDLTGFRNLEQIDGDINILTAWPYNPFGFSIDDLYDFNDLANFKKAGKGIDLRNCHFKNVDKIITDSVINGDLHLWGGSLVGFKDLSNLNMIQEVTGSLFIGRADVNNDQISLKNLKHVGGDFTLQENSNLTSLDFLNHQLKVDGDWKLSSIGGMEVCESFALCNHINSGGSYSIFSSYITCFINNPSICNSLLSIEAVDNKKKMLSIYPIPSNNTIHISMNNVDIVNYQIYDSKGSALMNGSIENHSTIHINDLPDGLYILRAHEVGSTNIYSSQFMKTSQ